MKHTISEKVAGELAVRRLSEKAASYYDETDPITIWEYSEEEKTLYAVDNAGDVQEDLSFSELDDYLCNYYDATH